MVTWTVQYKPKANTSLEQAISKEGSQNQKLLQASFDHLAVGDRCCTVVRMIQVRSRLEADKIVAECAY